jgi:predicted DNA-binding transcriptional regulator YafY
MQRLEAVRDAIGERRVLRLDYRDASGKPSAREIWPLALYFWGGTWTVGAWCESREDFRNFRVDRIAELEALQRRYPDQPGRRLADFLRAVQGASSRSA